MEENSFLLFVIGLALTLLGLIFSFTYYLTRVSVGKKPLIDLLEGYKKNPKFVDLHFEIIEDWKIVGKINEISIELIPGLKEDGGMEFKLTIDLSAKPNYNNLLNLKNAFGRLKFEQDGTKVIVTSWEPKIFNYGKFDKVLFELQLIIDKIENKTPYSSKSWYTAD